MDNKGKKNAQFNDLTIKCANNLTWQSSENIRAEYCNGKISRGETGTHGMSKAWRETGTCVHWCLHTSVSCHSQHSILNSLPGTPMCVAECIILHCLSKCSFSWNLRVGSKHLRRGWFVSSSPCIDMYAISRHRPKETIQHSCTAWQEFVFLLISACLELPAASTPHCNNGSANTQDVRGCRRSCWLLLYEQNQPSIWVCV